MIPYPDIRPEIFTIPAFDLGSLTLGPLSVRWYGFMYVIGYLIAFQLLKRRARAGLIRINYRACENMITYMIIGMLLGARLTYAFVYNWDYYSVNLSHLFRIWEGGLSFHGAAIGMFVASILFARNYKLEIFEVSDSLAFCSAPALFFGRMGNFINAELYGRASDVPWAMIFPTDRDHVPRHPSQLYEAFCEGVVLFAFLYLMQKKAIEKKVFRRGQVGALYLIAYGVLRFLIEFTREPDAQLGFVAGPFSMGQVLCFLMILIGSVVLFYVQQKKPLVQPKLQAETVLAQDETQTAK